MRALGGEATYRSDFIAQYLLPVLYPEDLTRDLQLLLGTGVVVLNAAVYWWLWRRCQARGASEIDRVHRVTLRFCIKGWVRPPISQAF